MPKLLESLFESSDLNEETTAGATSKPAPDETAVPSVEDTPSVELVDETAELEETAPTDGAALKKPAKPARAKRQKPVKTKQPQPAREKAPAGSTTWTYGGVVRSKLVTAGVWCALGAGVIGFLSVAVQALNPTEAVAQKVADRTPTDPALAVASGFATQYAAAYVSASQSDSAALSLFTDPGTLALPESAPQVDAVAAAGATKTKDGIYQVTVAVTTEAAAAPAGDSSTGQPTQISASSQISSGKPAARVLRYLSVPVAVQSGVAAPAGLPGYVAAPTGRAVQLSGFSTQVTLTSGTGQTVSGFLQAYLAGSTDVSRFEAPTISIPPVTPAVADGVQVTSLVASDNIPDSPADGDTAHVQVVASLKQAGSPAGSVSYVLDLKARAGRWEVTAVNDQSTTTPQTPAPAPTSTPEGKKK